MSVAVRTQEAFLDGELVGQEGLVTFRGRDGGIAGMTAFVDGDVYYARIGRDGIADVFSAPANVLSLEDRLTRDFGGRTGRSRLGSARTRRKGRRGSRRRRSLK